MKIFDAHCDVLWKLWENPKLSFLDDPALHITHQGLKERPGSVQTMAMYIPDEVPISRKYEAALEMVDIFYEKIVKPYDHVKVIKKQADIHTLEDNEIGVLLALEGCDAIGTDLVRLRTLHRLGVRSVGLTWNHANAVADGVMEERGAGLTNFGRELVKELNELKVWTDVSHLSEKGFWEVMELADYPVATHSNAKALCPHPRNLTDKQIQALIEKNGVIGMNFLPFFLTEEMATVKDVVKHIEHICQLGGEFHVGFGSDFDGIDSTPIGLESYEKFDNLINELMKHYSATQVENFCYHNFVRRVI